MEFLSPERLSKLFKVTEPDSSGVGKGGWHVSFPSQTFLLLGAEDASFWQPMPFLSPRIMVDLDFQTPFPPFGEPSGRPGAGPGPSLHTKSRATGPPVTGESFYHLFLFLRSLQLQGSEFLLRGEVSPGASRDWLGATSPPEPPRPSATEGLCGGVGTALGFGADQRPFSKSELNGGMAQAGLPGLTLPPRCPPALPQPHSCVGGEGGEGGRPPARLPEGWEMSRPGN